MCSFHFITYSFVLDFEVNFRSQFLFFSTCVNMDSNLRCRVHPDKFCFVCGQYMLEKDKKTITSLLAEAYIGYFGRTLENHQPWAPSYVCKTCYDNLRQWKMGKRPSMPFAQPMLWNNSTNHPIDCYFCNAHVSGYNKLKKNLMKYPDVPSVTKPIPHDTNNPKPSISLGSTSTNAGKSTMIVTVPKLYV